MFPAGYYFTVMYIYNFNFRPGRVCSTYGELVQTYYDDNNNLLGFDLAIQPNLLAITSASTPLMFGVAGRLYLQRVTSDGSQENWDNPASLYVGPDNENPNGPNLYTSTNVTAVDGTVDEQLGGTVRYWIPASDVGSFPYNQMAVGQWWALFRGYGMQIGATVRVYQGINTQGTGYYYPSNNQGAVDWIDCHQNRLLDAPFLSWIEGPLGQLSLTGTARWWHSSFDGGIDDPLDLATSVNFVEVVDFATNTLVLNGYPGGPGTPYSFGSYPDVLSSYAILTVLSTTGKNITFAEPLPARVVAGDVIVADTGVPTLLHIKNFNCANHHDSCLNIKANTILIEDSLFLNASFAGETIGGDLTIYFEVGLNRNVTIRNNVYERNALAFQTAFATPYGEVHSLIYSLTVTDNIVYANFSDQYGVLVPLMGLYAVSNFNVSNNQFVILAGPNTGTRPIVLCNANRGVLINNSYTNLQPDANRWGGQTCYPSTINPPAADCPDATQLPGWYEALDQSCMLNLTYDVYQSGNGWPQYTRFDQYHELRLDADIVWTGQPNYQPEAASTLEQTHAVAYAPYVVDSTGFNWTHGAFDCSASPGSYLTMESPYNGLTDTADHLSLWQVPFAADVWLNVLEFEQQFEYNFFTMGDTQYSPYQSTFYISQWSTNTVTIWLDSQQYHKSNYRQCGWPGYNQWIMVSVGWSGFNFAQNQFAESGAPNVPGYDNGTFTVYVNGQSCGQFQVPQGTSVVNRATGQLGPFIGYFGSVNVYKGTAATTEAAVSQRYQYTLQHGGQSAPHVQQYLVPDVSLSDSSTVQVAWASDAASLQAISINPDLPTDTLQVECAVYAPSLYDVTGEGELFGAVQPAGALQLAFDGDASTAFSSDSPYAIVGLSFEQPAFIERVDLTPAPGSVQDMLGGSVYGGNSRRIDEDSTLLFTFDASLVDCYMDGTPLSTGLLGTGRSFRYVWYTGASGGTTSVAEMRVYARQWLATSTYQPQAVASYAVNVSSTAGTATFDGVSNAASLDVVCSLTSLPVYEAWLPKYYFPASNRLLPASTCSA